MAQIIIQEATPDGWDVTCILSTGEQHVFHFSAQPADVQGAVDENEKQWIAAQIQQKAQDQVQQIIANAVAQIQLALQQAAQQMSG